MIYSIIFNKYEEGKLISWLDSNEFKTEKEANDFAGEMSRIWWNEGENISWMTLYHSCRWKQIPKEDAR